MRVSLFTWVLVFVAASASAQTDEVAECASGETGEANAASEGNIAFVDEPTIPAGAFTLTLHSREHFPVRVHYEMLPPQEGGFSGAASGPRLQLAETAKLTTCTTPCQLPVFPGTIELSSMISVHDLPYASPTTFEVERDFTVEVDFVNFRATKTVLYSVAGAAVVWPLIAGAFNAFFNSSFNRRAYITSSIALGFVGGTSLMVGASLRSHYRYRVLDE